MTDRSLIPVYDKKFSVVLLFGPPGSGKGTLGKHLGAAGGHYHLSSGDIFRSLDPESPAGKVFDQYAGQGQLVPDAVVMEVLLNYVRGLMATSHYFPSKQLLLLDGLPRTEEQAEILKKYADIKSVIVLDVPDIEVLITRLNRRATIEKRSDDRNPEIIKRRMEVYSKQTNPILKHYDPKIISRFNANQRPLEVLRDVLVELSPVLCG